VSKFKVGDVVVNTTAGDASFWNGNMPLHTRGVVIGLDGRSTHMESGWLLVNFEFDEYPRQVLPPDRFMELELEAIINSPLYKALS
jgi:hypothetical protein